MPNSKTSSENSGKHGVFIYIHKPTKPVFFNESFLSRIEEPERQKIQDLNKKGWIFSVNVVAAMEKGDGRLAVSLMYCDSENKIPPFFEVCLNNADLSKALLDFPKKYFEPFESDILTISGRYDDKQVGEMVGEWTKSATKN
jgi:hypothetical protein